MDNQPHPGKHSVQTEQAHQFCSGWQRFSGTSDRGKGGVMRFDLLARRILVPALGLALAATVAACSSSGSSSSNAAAPPATSPSAAAPSSSGGGNRPALPQIPPNSATSFTSTP